MMPRPPSSTLFPYTTLFRSVLVGVVEAQVHVVDVVALGVEDLPEHALAMQARSEEHTSELQSRGHLVCRLLLEKKKTEGEVRSQAQALPECRAYNSV